MGIPAPARPGSGPRPAGAPLPPRRLRAAPPRADRQHAQGWRWARKRWRACAPPPHSPPASQLSPCRAPPGARDPAGPTGCVREVKAWLRKESDGERPSSGLTHRPRPRAHPSGPGKGEPGVCQWPGPEPAPWLAVDLAGSFGPRRVPLSKQFPGVVIESAWPPRAHAEATAEVIPLGHTK